MSLGGPEASRAAVSGADAARAAAYGMPPELRPRLWLQFANAEEALLAAGSGYYEALAARGVGETAAAEAAEAATKAAEAAAVAAEEEVTTVAAAATAAAFAEATGEDAPSNRVPVAAVPSAVAAAAAEAAAAAKAAAAKAAAAREEEEKVARQIELDLPRTFPEHAQFASAEGRAALRRVLLAHARRNPAIGYTQSMNFLAAFLLIVLPEEVRTAKRAHEPRGTGCEPRPSPSHLPWSRHSYLVARVPACLRACVPAPPPGHRATRPVGDTRGGELLAALRHHRALTA